MAILRVILILAATLAATVFAQDDEVPAERAVKPPVAITFTPPGLDGDIVLGIFDAAGRLVRTLRFEPGAPELKIDTNGYIASWDGKDERGAACPAGRYAAHGYVVGDDVTVTGEAFHFNDWLAEDQIPALGAELVRWPDALGVKLATPGNKAVFAKIRPDGALERTDEAPAASPADAAPKFATPPLAWTRGRDGSAWLIVDAGGQRVVTQLAKDGSTERTLRVAGDEPQPASILASPTEDAILLRETGADGAERVRMLRRGAGAAPQADGRIVADWEVVFERTRQPCTDFGVMGGKLAANAGEAKPKITVALVANALQPEGASLVLRAVARRPGSALAAPDGLGLLDVAAAGDWSRFALVPGAAAGSATLYQGDGLVVEQFTLDHLDRIGAFDAGSFLLAPAQ